MPIGNESIYLQLDFQLMGIMKIKNLLFSLVLVCVSLSVGAQNNLTLGVQNKVRSTFWGFSFGSSTEQLQKALKNARQECIVDDGDIYVQDVELVGSTFKTVALFFSPLTGGFYKVVGSNKFDNKKEAMAFYNQTLANVKEFYPKVQQLSDPSPADKRWVYPDDENVFSLELLSLKKDAGKIYYVRVNFWNIVAQEKITEAAGK